MSYYINVEASGHPANWNIHLLRISFWCQELRKEQDSHRKHLRDYGQAYVHITDRSSQRWSQESGPSLSSVTLAPTHCRLKIWNISTISIWSIIFQWVTITSNEYWRNINKFLNVKKILEHFDSRPLPHPSFPLSPFRIPQPPKRRHLSLQCSHRILGALQHANGLAISILFHHLPKFLKNQKG